MCKEYRKIRDLTKSVSTSTSSGFTDFHLLFEEDVWRAAEVSNCLHQSVHRMQRQWTSGNSQSLHVSCGGGKPKNNFCSSHWVTDRGGSALFWDKHNKKKPRAKLGCRLAVPKERKRERGFSRTFLV